MKIAVITINDLGNIGNRLQNYAVCNILSNYGEVFNLVRYEDRLIFESKLTKIKKDVRSLSKFVLKNKKYQTSKNRKMNFIEFNNNIPNADVLNYKSNYNRLSEKYDIFCTGSDQVWNPNFCNNMFLNMLGFTSNRKFSISASIGVEELSDNQIIEFKKYLDSFERISCREESGVQLIRKITSNDAALLIDPTLMLDAKDWDIVCKKPLIDSIPNNYILIYTLGGVDDKTKSIIDEISKKYNLEVINLSDQDSKYYSCGPAEFIWMIKHCSLTITDSFHATVFSYLFNKPIRIFKRQGSFNMNSRFNTLLEILNLPGYLLLDEESIKSNIFEYKYDYSVLDKERAKLSCFLDEIFDK